MTVVASVATPRRFEMPAAPAREVGSEAFRVALSQASAIRSETPEPGEQQAGVRQAGQPAPRPGTEGASTAGPETAGAGGVPPGGRRPLIAAASNADDNARITHLLNEIRAARLQTLPYAKLNDYATAMLEVHRSSAPQALKEDCLQALEQIMAAGGRPRPSMSVLARAAASPNLGLRAGLSIASLLNSLSTEDIEAMPAEQRDTLFSQYRELRANRDLNNVYRWSDRLPIVSASDKLLQGGAFLQLSNPLTKRDVDDIRTASPLVLARALAAMTDQQLTGISERQLIYTRLTDRLGIYGPTPPAAQAEANRVLALNAHPSTMQPKIDEALAGFPGLSGTMRLTAVSLPQAVESQPPPAPAVDVTTGAIPAALQAHQSQTDRNALVNIVIAKVALMDDYMIDQSASTVLPQFRRPGETTFTPDVEEASLFVPPGTEIRIGTIFDAFYAQFTLPPID